MTARMLRWLAAPLSAVCLMVLATPGWAQEPTVHAVLFFSPTCPHCQIVIEGTILPLLDQYGDRLEIVVISTITPEGQELYRAAVERFDIPSDRLGVPTLIVGQTILVGSVEIPDQFPGIIEAGLVQGGIAWPDIPGLADLLASTPDSPAGTTAPQAPTAEPPLRGATPGQAGDPDPQPALAEDTGSAWESNWMQDPLGNSLSIFVLVGMLASTAAVGYQLTQGTASTRVAQPGWGIPALALIGMLIAGYLAFVETSGTEAVCGPVGDCNTVQQSKYAILFGVLPVGVLGVVGYLALIGTWVVAWLGPSDWAWLALFAQTAFGVVFSIYLTFLEPFVIGATCAWCLSSAVIMTALLWLTSEPARGALQRLRGRTG